MAKNKTRIIIKLLSSSGHFYTTTKNKKGSLKLVKLKKFDPFIKKHNIYIENKIKK